MNSPRFQVKSSYLEIEFEYIMRKVIREEVHKSNLSIHPDAIKMYQNLKKMLW